MGVSVSLDQFAAKLTTYQNRVSKTQLDQFNRSKRGFYRELIKAATLAGGPDRTLSRVGKHTGPGTRVGSKLGFSIRDVKSNALVGPGDSGGAALEIKKLGQWQLVDDSVNYGRTKPHPIKPRANNKRPLYPAKKVAPTLKVVYGTSGSYPTGHYFGPPGNRAGVMHSGSERAPYWGRAIRTVRHSITESWGKDYQRIGREVFP